MEEMLPTTTSIDPIVKGTSSIRAFYLTTEQPGNLPRHCQAAQDKLVANANLNNRIFPIMGPHGLPTAPITIPFSRDREADHRLSMLRVAVGPFIIP